MSDFSFKKKERLCSKRIIGDLYKSPDKAIVFPLSLHWMPIANAETPIQVLIVAPKKKLHHAVDRNRAKRLMRECFRLHKGTLAEKLESEGKSIAVSINYIHSELVSFAQMEKRFIKLFEELERQCFTGILTCN